jgi:PAS domain S-box-containing protein
MSRLRARVDRAHKTRNEQLLHETNRLQSALIRGVDSARILGELANFLVEVSEFDNAFIARSMPDPNQFELVAIVDSTGDSTNRQRLTHAELAYPDLLDPGNSTLIRRDDSELQIQLPFFSQAQFEQTYIATLSDDSSNKPGELLGVVVLTSDVEFEFDSQSLAALVECCETVLIGARDITSRVKTERDLQDSEARLTLLLNETPSVLWSMDNDLRFTTSAGRGLANLGLVPGQVVGMTLVDFLGDAPTAATILGHHQAALAGQIVQYEAAFGDRFYHIRVEPILDSHGEIEGCRGVGHDMTERIKAESERLKTEEQWKTVVENVPDFMLVIDELGQIKFINHLGVGWTRDQVIEKTVFEFNPPEFHATIQSAMTKVFGSGETVLYETTGRGSPDQWCRYMCRMAPMVGIDGSNLAILIATDVTDHLAAKEAEERHYSLLKTVTNGLPYLIFIKDLEGRFVFVNETTANIHGITPADVVGKTDFDLLPEDFAVRALEYDRQVYESSETLTYETKLPETFGNSRYMVTKSPWVNSAGQVIGILGISRDVSAQREYEETLERQRSEFFHASRLSTMGRMTAEISHEIRQPLAAISNYTGTCILGIGKSALSEEQFAKYLDLIAVQVRRADSIMERIQSFARRGSSTRSICQVRGLLRESVGVIRTELNLRRVTVRPTFLIKDDVFIDVDRVLLQQVIVNLLMNACDAMMGQPPNERKLEIRCEADDETVILSVIDSGPGISPEVITRIFEVFFTTKTEGMGIGLAICKEIVESHRGHLEAFNNSTPPGACFRMRIPRAKGHVNDTQSDHPSCG